jgi:flavin-dependent dehydrogenase
VVGAGPAGSAAAWSSSKEKLDTVIIDKKSVPGKDACAETLSKAFLDLLPFRIPSRFLQWPLEGLKFYYQNLMVTKDEDVWWKSFPLSRREFDPFVLEMAVKQGARYCGSTEFVSVKHDARFRVKEVVVRDLKRRELVRILPKVLIGADGVHSKVMECIGKQEVQKTAIGYIKSFEYQNLSLDDSHYGHIFFGDYADGAYAYIFPKSASSANIGIATLSSRLLDARFAKFLEVIKPQMKDARKVVDRSGKAPIKNPSRRLAYGSIIFTGDAANQNLKPFVEGIQPGIICGAFAGRAASLYLHQQKNLESSYKKLVYEGMGKLFLESDGIGSMLVSSFEQKDRLRYLLEFGMFSYSLDDRDFRKIRGMKPCQAEQYIRERLKV